MTKREFNITIGITTNHKYEAKNKIKEMLSGCEIVSVKCLEKRRTSQQNRALFLWFRLLSEALNSCGMDMRKTIRQDVNISWTPENVRHFLWTPLMKTLTGKKSTRSLTTNDINEIFDNLNRIIGERCNVFVPFPSLDNLANQEYY